MLGMMRAEATQFIRFGLVGGTGFLLDAGLLMILHDGLGLDPFTARLISISVSAFTTWRLNRGLTFGASERPQAEEAVRYAAVAIAAAGFNYLVYALALIVSPSIPPIAALIGATIAAMGLSYAGYSRFVFQGPRTTRASPSSQRR
jgi:putative flippase GtrA